MKKQKEISTLIGLLVVIAVAIIFFGAIIIFQNLAMKQIFSLMLKSCL